MDRCDTNKKKIILAYSGGLDTSCILAWLVEKGYKVTAYLADMGQHEDFLSLTKIANKMGAHEVIIDDMRSDFLRHFAWIGVACGLIYEGRYLLGTSLARPAICLGVYRAAEERNIKLYAHGATGKGNDQVRFELGMTSLDPEMQCFAPWRDKEFTDRFKGRQDLIAYAKSKGFPVPATQSAPYSIDANILHVSYESGVLEDPSKEAPEGIFTMTKDQADTPDKPYDIEITFEFGIPVKVQSLTDKMEAITRPLHIIQFLNKHGGEHGVGRIDIVENRFIGLKSRGVYESPGMTILYLSHLDLETYCLDREVLKVIRNLKETMSQYVYNGFWFSPEFEFVKHAIMNGQRDVNGTVKVRLFKGLATILGRSGGNAALYNQQLVSMDIEGGFVPSDSTGFIKCNAIRLKEYQRYLKEASCFSSNNKK